MKPTIVKGAPSSISYPVKGADHSPQQTPSYFPSQDPSPASTPERATQPKDTEKEPAFTAENIARMLNSPGQHIENAIKALANDKDALLKLIADCRR